MTEAHVGMGEAMENHRLGLLGARRRELLQTGYVVGGLGVLAVILYGGMLTNFFLTDDYTWMELARLFSDGNLSALFERPAGHFRPLQILILGLIYPWVGMNPIPYHLVSLSLHVVVCVLVFRLADIIVANRTYALLSASVFGVMVSHALAVSWIAPLHDIMATIFGLGAILLWLAYLRHGGRGRYVLTCTLFGLSLLSKELGVAIALILPAVEILLRPGSAPTNGPPLTSRVLRYSPFVLILAVYVAVRIPSGAVADIRFGPHFLSNMLALAVFTYFPVTQNILSQLPGVVRAPALFLWLPLVGVVATLIGYSLARGGSSGRFGAVLWLAPLLPVSWYYPPSNLMQMPAAMYSQYTYFPSVGASLCFAMIVRRALGSVWLPGVTRTLVWSGVGMYMIANAVGVVTYNNMSLRSAGEQGRGIVGQMDKLIPLLRANDTLFFDGDNESMTWTHMRVGSLLFLFWNLRNEIYLVFAQESDKADWSRRWPLGILNPPTVVIGSLKDLALTCRSGDGQVLFTEDRGVVRLIRCGQSR